MALFGKRKMDTTAPMVLPEPTTGPTTIHNHGIPWVGIIVVAFGCLIAALPVLWWMLVFLADRAGFRDPEAAIAWFLLFAPMVAGLVGLVRWAILDGWAMWLNAQVEIQKEMTRQSHNRLLTASASVDPGRMNSADYDFARVVVAVMQKAFDFLEANPVPGKFPARWRPWSMRSALETAEAIGVKLSQDRANSVSTWLYERGIIDQPDGGQITRRFQDLASVRRVIDAEYGKPIRLNNPPIISGSDNWSIIP